MGNDSTQQQARMMRERAAEARALATNASPRLKVDLLAVAQLWDLLARETESACVPAVPPEPGVIAVAMTAKPLAVADQQ